MQKISYKSKTFRLVFSALMIALSTVLSMISIGLPMGGSITPGSMVPLIVVCSMYGFGWGALSCTVYGLLQMLLGMDNFSYVTTIVAVVIVALFDYLVAYGAISLSAVAKNAKRPVPAAIFGSLLAMCARFVCHLISGAVVWGQWADVTALPGFLQSTRFAGGNWLIWSYSFFYNLSYMLPETIITVVLAAIIVPLVRKAIKEEN